MPAISSGLARFKSQVNELKTDSKLPALLYWLLIGVLFQTTWKESDVQDKNKMPGHQECRGEGALTRVRHFFQFKLRHSRDPFGELDFRLPAQKPFGLGRIADETHWFGRTHQACFV